MSNALTVNGNATVYPSSYNPANNYLQVSTSTAGAPNNVGASITITCQLGTTSSPTAISNGTELGFVQCYGWDGSSFNQQFPDAWVFVATESWTSTAHGCITAVQATPNGSNNGRDELYVGGGVVVPNAINQRNQSSGKGWGTINALSGVYDSGNRVYSASNGVIIPMAFSGGTAAQGPGTTWYYGSGVASQGSAGSTVQMPVGGTLSNLYVTFSNAPGSSQNYTATLYAASTSTGITATASGSGSSTVTVSDTTHSFSCSAGVSLALVVVTSSGAASIAGGLCWGFTITR